LDAKLAAMELVEQSVVNFAENVVSHKGMLLPP
jgi:hypothetical protein